MSWDFPKQLYDGCEGKRFVADLLNGSRPCLCRFYLSVSLGCFTLEQENNMVMSHSQNYEFYLFLVSFR